MSTKNKNIVKIGGVLVLGFLIGWLIFGGNNAARLVEDEHAHTEAEENQIWTCSMHPQIRQNGPGDCPICGMELIPAVNAGTETDNPATFQMSENAMKLANVSTMEVGKSAAARTLRLNGKVELNETNTVTQSSHIPGRIESLKVNFTGEQVQRGQILAAVYSPELVTAQEELIQAAKIRESQPELFEAAKEKLRNWRIGENQINQILTSGKPLERFPITADVSGIVTEKLVNLGDYVERGMPIYQIADLSEVWVLFDLYEGQVGWVKEGNKVEFTVRALPGETFKGEITFVDPLLNSQSRVARARVVVDNSEGKLKPEMFVSGTVQTELGEATSNELVVPRSAVLWTGTRSVVYVKEKLGNNVGFTLREIVLGPALADAYLVKEGLRAGEEIVVNGTFTVDAAAQLAGKPSMMNPEAGAGTGNDQAAMEGGPADVIVKERPDLSGVSKDFKEQLSAVVDAYLVLKKDLVEGKDGGKSGAGLLKTVEAVDANLLSTEAGNFWAEYGSVLTEHAKLTKEAKSIEEKRENFISLSSSLIKLVQAFGSDKLLFVDHCPMANSDRGAYWLSEVEEIRNPYFGDAMLTCGEVVLEINKKIKN